MTNIHRTTVWARANPDKRKTTKKRYRENHPERYILKAARDNAKTRNLEFDLEESDIVIPNVCPVFNVPFVVGTRYAPSIDRIDSTKGYIKSNIQIISRIANTMKNDASAEELKAFATWILNG